MDVHFVIITLWIVVLNDFKARSQSVLALTGPVVAIQGTEYTLECQTDLAAVNWYKGSENIGQSNNQYEQYDNSRCYFNSQTGRNLYEFKDCGVKHKLTIKSIDYNRDNGRVWECQANYDYRISSLTVKVLALTGPVVAIQGSEYTLECKTDLAAVNWYKGSDFIGQSETNEYNNLRCYFNSKTGRNLYEFKDCGVKHKLSIKSIDYDRDNGTVWRCQANYDYRISSSLTVKVPVTSVEIKSTNLNSSILSVEESQQFVIQCVTSFAYPEPTVDLFICNGLNNKCGTYTAKKSDDTQTSITFQVLLNSTLQLDDTRVYCSARNTLPVINSTSVTLYILHHPKIRVQADDGNLLCIAEGRPEIMTFLPWKHSIDNKLVREIEGYYINTTVYSLNITNNQNDEGNYICTVNNGIPDPVTKQLDQMTSYQLNLDVEPTLYNVESSNNLEVGNNGGFSFEYLQDNTVNVSWNRDGQKLENNSRVTMSEEPTEISHPYNNTITLSGIKTTLTITSIIITDQGNYICDICNQYGCSHADFHLVISDDVKANVNENEKDKDDENMTITILAVVVSVLIVAFVVVIVIIVYKKYNASKRDENSLYDTTVPTPAPLYDAIGMNEHNTESSEYDRPVHDPTTPASDYTTLGSNNPYVNAIKPTPDISIMDSQTPQTD